MQIDANTPVLGSVSGRFQGLDLTTPFYLGGTPRSMSAAAEDTGFDNGFVGASAKRVKN